MQRCDYLESLEEERRKIQVFHRELPLCLKIITQTIDSYRQQLSGTTTENKSESSVQISCQEEEPLLEEFVLLKSSSDSDFEQEQQSQHNNSLPDNKSDWLRSVQLWNQAPQNSVKKPALDQGRINGICGAFKPFQREVQSEKSPERSTADTGNLRRKEERDDCSQRKMRRCWSPELHRRFLNALQDLGGAHGATPKQIRELMKVDGLTNDEVKSHLQKYRLHTRRPSGSSAIGSQSSQLVVGGILVHPPKSTQTQTQAFCNSGQKMLTNTAHSTHTSPSTSSSTHT